MEEASINNTNGRFEARHGEKRRLKTLQNRKRT